MRKVMLFVLITCLVHGAYSLAGDAPATLCGCANTAGLVRFVVCGSSCFPWERPISVNVQGPAGPVGPAGPTGPAGPPGPTGPAGSDAQAVILLTGSFGPTPFTGVDQIVFSGPGTGSAASAAAVYVPIPYGTLRNLRVRVDPANSASPYNDVGVLVRLASGADTDPTGSELFLTALTTRAGANYGFSVLDSDEVIIAPTLQNPRICLELRPTESGMDTGPYFVKWSLELVPTTAP